MGSIESLSSATPASTMGAQSTTGTNKAQDQKNQFLQLLVAQLKGQNPLDPLDGTQFVTQLAQFTSLEELTSINAVLKNIEGYLKTAVQPPQSSNPSQIF